MIITELKLNHYSSIWCKPHMPLVSTVATIIWLVIFILYPLFFHQYDKLHFNTESRAISKYILRKHGSDLLRESNLSESAMVDVWLEVESSHFDGAMSPIIFQCFIVPMFMGGATDIGVVNESLEKLKKALEVYEAQLSKSKYLAGDFISLADISISRRFITCWHLPMLLCSKPIRVWRLGSMMWCRGRAWRRWQRLWRCRLLNKNWSYTVCSNELNFSVAWHDAAVCIICMTIFV